MNHCDTSINAVSISGYKHFTSLIILFFIALFVNDVTVYKLVKIGGITLSAASIIFPLTYLITDIITEVYGYQQTRKLIWLTTIYNVIFALFITLLLELPSPVNWKLGPDFSAVFENLLYLCIIHTIASPASYFINAYVISKWKILVKGKYFWLRSIGSSFIGEAIFSVIMTAITWHSSQTVSLFPLICITYATKLIWGIAGAYPATLVVRFLKKSEGVDIYDTNTNFNPFSNKKINLI